MKKVSLIILVVVLLITISAVGTIYLKTTTEIERNALLLKKAVAKDFHDPETARFRSLRIQTDEGSVLSRLKRVDLKLLWEATPAEVLSIFRYDPEAISLCGEVNARNAFGAYAGYKPFYVSGGNDPIIFISTSETDDLPVKLCAISEDNVVWRGVDPEFNLP